MAEPSGYVLVSELTRQMKPAGLRGGQRNVAPVGKAAPAGVCHALARGGTTTVCGLDVVKLHVWDQPFERGFVDRCEVCREVAWPAASS